MSSTFQTILLVVFGFALVIGALIFAGVLPGFRQANPGVAGEIVIWGTTPTIGMTDVVETINKQYGSQFTLSYKEKDADNFNEQLTEALANGNGPDMILAPHEFILQNASRIFPMPAQTISLRTFKDTFIDEGLLLTTAASDGFYGLPVTVDPLVLFYNKSLYANAGLVTPPESWEQFVANEPKLAVIDKNNNITQSAVALGVFSNITNAKDIFSLLLLQAGNPIISYSNGQIYKSLTGDFGYLPRPVDAALNFFLQFADPAKTTYNWNRSLPEARETFVAGKLANYFGLASELSYLQTKNPHLDFDVAVVPQAGQGNHLTFGRLYGVAVMKSSSKLTIAAQAIQILASQIYSQKLSKIMAMPSARRDILSAGTSDPDQKVFYDSAIIAHGWLDFAPADTGRIFRQMAETVASGGSSMSEAVSKAAEQMDRSF